MNQLTKPLTSFLYPPLKNYIVFNLKVKFSFSFLSWLHLQLKEKQLDLDTASKGKSQEICNEDCEERQFCTLQDTFWCFGVCLADFRIL